MSRRLATEWVRGDAPHEAAQRARARVATAEVGWAKHELAGSSSEVDPYAKDTLSLPKDSQQYPIELRQSAMPDGDQAEARNYASY